MTHPEVTAHAGWVCLGSLWAADVLDLLADGLEGGVNLSITVTQASFICPVAIWVRCLLRLGHNGEWLTNACRTGRTWGSGKTRRTLQKEKCFRTAETFEGKIRYTD